MVKQPAGTIFMYTCMYFRRKDVSESIYHQVQVWLIRVNKSREGFRVSRDMSLLVQHLSPNEYTNKSCQEFFFKTIKNYISGEEIIKNDKRIKQ